MVIHTDEIIRLSNATDASFYRIVPEKVVKPTSIYDIISLINQTKHGKKHLCFRGSGTSLSGQALTDGLLVDLSGQFNKFEIDLKSKTVFSECGVIAGKINQKLKRNNKILGPDPASINSCTIGGMIANNSSGMRSGIDRNVYNSLKSLKYILHDGFVIDSSLENSNDLLQQFQPDIYNGILSIKQEIESQQIIKDKIIKGYSIKNTIGYSMNSFIDFEKPIDILSHLMVGSEGTLSFIYGGDFEYCDDYPNKETGLLIFNDLSSACNSIKKIKSCDVNALEIIDYNSLKSVIGLKSIPSVLKEMKIGCSALLFEFQEERLSDLKEKRDRLLSIIPEFNLYTDLIISNDEIEQANLWSIRKGLLPSLGATKPIGDTFILEDLCFDLDDFKYAIPDLQNLFIKYGYLNTGIYGHCMDGNIHFMITENFDSEKSITKYSDFMNELAYLVVDKYSGALKAEHGTGRNMAPFVEKQWGRDIYNLMKRVKKLIDPDNIFNPNVIITDNNKIHLENIKSYPKIEDEVEKCIECGFCEVKCPSKDFTFTPRKRISILRELSRTKLNSIERFENLKKEYEYYSINTCAIDGMCATQCPVEINTGELIKKLRINQSNKFVNKLALIISDNFEYFELIMKISNYSAYLLGSLLGNENLEKSIIYLKEKFKFDLFPVWNQKINLPTFIKAINKSNPEFIYFPCCTTRMMGKPDGNTSLDNIILSISSKANIEVKIPENISRYCCGTIFSSKGLKPAYLNSLYNLIDWLWIESQNGELPVIFDSSSCSHTIKSCFSDLDTEHLLKWEQLKILDSTEYINKHILSKSLIINKSNMTVLHPTCSSIKSGFDEQIKHIAEKLSNKVIIPDNLGCCGMAGDRGLMYPELTKNATNNEASEVNNYTADGYYSSNIPCEIAMSKSVNKQYLSIAYLVDKSI